MSKEKINESRSKIIIILIILLKFGNNLNKREFY